MASTYSSLKIELIATGEQSGTWGTTTNNNLGDAALGEAITGSADVAFSSADVTVTLTDTNASQAARNLRLNLTGTSGGARQLILGSGCQIEKLYLINNGLADAVTVKNTGGTGIAVPAGKSMFVYNNGTNVVDAVTHLSSLTLGSALPVTSGGTGTTSTTFVNAATNVTGTLPIANGGTGTTSTTFVNAATNVTGTLPVANGGTGASTLTSNNVILGAGTSAVTFVAPGSNGNVLTSDGSTWTSAAAGGGGSFQTQLFTAPGTWTKPATATQVRVTVVGGGGGGLPSGFSNVVGGFGGIAIAQVPVSAPVSVTVGGGGGGGSAGGTSSFGPAASATGGAAGNPAGTPGSPGSGTVSVGTAFKTGSGLATNAPPASAQNASIGVILGLNRNASGAGAVAYSTSSAYAAGAGGAGLPAVGGGIGGAVVVEFVG